MPISHVFQVTNTNLTDWAGVVTVANSSGGTATVQATDMVQPSDWNSNHVISLSASDIASMFSAEHRVTITTGAGGLTFGLDNQIAFYEPIPAVQAALSAISASYWFFDPVQVAGALNSGQIRQFFALAGNSALSNSSVLFGFPASTWSGGSTGTLSKGLTVYNRMGLFLRGNGTDASSHSDSLYSYYTADENIIFSYGLSLQNNTQSTSSLSATFQAFVSFPSTLNSAGGRTYGTTGATVTVTSISAATFASNQIASVASLNAVGSMFNGSMMWPVPLSYRVSAGEWYFGYNQFWSTASAGAAFAGVNLNSAASTMSKLVVTEGSSMSAYKSIGISTANTSSVYFPGHGVSSTTATTFPNSVNLTGLRPVNLSSQHRLYWNYDNYTN